MFILTAKMNIMAILVYTMLLLGYVISKQLMTFKIVPTNEEAEIKEVMLDSINYDVRAEGAYSYFVMFMNKNKYSSGTQSFIKIAPSKGEMFEVGKMYNHVVAEDSVDRKEAILNFFYSEPNGIKFHCFESEQEGHFVVNELSIQFGKINKIFITFKINCKADTLFLKNGVSGTIHWIEDKVTVNAIQVTDNKVIKLDSLKFLA